uniref:DNA-directed DNA polymerase n=1 Tax=Globodera rostochiensis TaxID=31243 RepID=A0A914HAJ3_GLORO
MAFNFSKGYGPLYFEDVTRFNATVAYDPQILASFNDWVLKNRPKPMPTPPGSPPPILAEVQLPIPVIGQDIAPPQNYGNEPPPPGIEQENDDGFAEDVDLGPEPLHHQMHHVYLPPPPPHLQEHPFHIPHLPHVDQRFFWPPPPPAGHRFYMHPPPPAFQQLFMQPPPPGLQQHRFHMQPPPVAFHPVHMPPPPLLLQHAQQQFAAQNPVAQARAMPLNRVRWPIRPWHGRPVDPRRQRALFILCAFWFERCETVEYEEDAEATLQRHTVYYYLMFRSNPFIEIKELGRITTPAGKHRVKQSELAFKLMENLEINTEAKSYGIGTLEVVQAYWDRTYTQMYRIVAFDVRIGLKPIFKGDGVRKHNVCVIMDEDHWDGLKSVTQFFKYRIVAYDLETTKVKGEHQPNLVSAAVTCSVCSGEEKECEICDEGPKMMTWAKFLKERHIPIVPEGGFERSENQSKIAIRYFEWLARRDGVKVRHACNGGELEFGGLKVDCVIGAQKKIIEFQGCAWHGCTRCFLPWTIGPNGLCAAENYRRTEIRMEQLRDACGKMTLCELWECEVKEQLKKNKEMKRFFDNVPDKGPINPRDAYSGGRTMPFCLFAEASKNVEISMFDIISLYPFVNYNTPYPVGIPKIKKVNAEVLWTQPDDIPFDGLLKVKVIPPKNLMYPLLALHIDDMLLFPLCGVCARREKKDFIMTKDVKKCNHRASQRALMGTFTSIELRKAMELGYRVVWFYRAYHFEEFDSQLFKGYVRMFLKIKIEASGWASDVKTEKEKQAFIDMYRAKYDIYLERENIKKNPGLRLIAKLGLNSLWGKFSMRNTLSTTELVNNEERWDEIINDDTLEFAKPTRINESMVRVIYKKKEEFIKEHNVSNIILSLWSEAVLVEIEAKVGWARLAQDQNTWDDIEHEQRAHL